MNIASDELAHDDPSRLDVDPSDDRTEAATAAVDPGVRLAGTDVFRGLLVIVTALIIGGFVITRGLNVGDGTDTSDPSGPTAATDGALAGDATGDTADEGTLDVDGSGLADGAAGLSGSDAGDSGASEGEPATEGADAADGVAGAEVVPEAVPQPALRPANEVKVLVLNAAQRQGVAGRGTELLVAANYLTGAPKNADVTGAPSAIVYAEGYEAEAVAVAAVFAPGLEGLVQPLDPAAPPIVDTQEANVIVVIGPDGLIPIP